MRVVGGELEADGRPTGVPEAGRQARLRAAATTLLGIELLVQQLEESDDLGVHFDLACRVRDDAMAEMTRRLADVPADEPLRPALARLTGAYAAWSSHWDQLGPSQALDAAFAGLGRALGGSVACELDAPKPPRPTA